MSGFLSVLDTRKKEWQNRKRWWIQKHSIQSELGREDTISKSRFWDDTNVSIFDAKLCEEIYTSFIPPSGSILDPFAGGSVRGIVAEELGFNYTGIELSKEQIDANKLQSNKPTWICGDSEEVLDTLQDQYDLVFTCPPYHDLEIYSDNPNDLSNMAWDEFLIKYKSIIQKSYDKLKDNRFFIIVVSEIRDRTTTGNYKIGKYKGFVPSTIRIAEECGFHYYNDVVLINASQQSGRVSNLYFNRNRKVASTHQNVLMFVKGNSDLATEDIQWDGTYVCEIDGKKYKAFREAAIHIDADKLVASEVERRCTSTNYKYKNWNIIGVNKAPDIKYKIDGALFQSTSQIVNVLRTITENNVRTWVYSNLKNWQHWQRVSPADYNISYIEMENTWSTTIRFELNTISCEGIEFTTIKAAADHFNLSSERIRQKLISDKHTDYYYLN
jgi:DNA modification methylase